MIFWNWIMLFHLGRINIEHIKEGTGKNSSRCNGYKGLRWEAFPESAFTCLASFLLSMWEGYITLQSGISNIPCKVKLWISLLRWLISAWDERGNLPWLVFRLVIKLLPILTCNIYMLIKAIRGCLYTYFVMVRHYFIDYLLFAFIVIFKFLPKLSVMICHFLFHRTS